MIRSNPIRIAGLFLAYALTALVLFYRCFDGSRSWFDFGDSAQQSWPWLLSVAHAARHGHLLLWEFGSQAGVSLAGELQPAPFYPVTWILGWIGLDGIILCNTYVLLHFAFACMGMHLLLRSEGLSRSASVLGAALFGFAGYLPFQANAQPNIFASLCWIPWVIFAARRCFIAPNLARASFYCALTGLAGGMQIMAGHMHPFVHDAYAVMLCAATSTIITRSPRPFAFGLASLTLALAFAAVPLWLANEYLHLCYRWYATGMSQWPHAVPQAAYATGSALRLSDFRGLLHPSTLAEQDGSLFIGWTASCLVIFGLFRRRNFTLAMVAIGMFGILVGLGGHLAIPNRLISHLPLLPQLRTPIRAACLVSFSLASLAACGVDRLRDLIARARTETEYLTKGVMITALLLCGWQIERFDAGVGRPATNPNYPPIAIGENAALNALLKITGQQPRTDPLVGRVLCVPRDLIPPNAGDLVPIMNVMGQRATMMVSLFNELSKNWGPVSSASLDELGVRWVVSDHPMSGLELKVKGDGFWIYERPSSLSVLWSETHGGERRPAAVRNANWGDDTVAFELIPGDRSQLLIFAQPSYPGWVAAADGRSVSLIKHGIFSAASIPAGTREVRFSYSPDLRIPTAISVLAWLILIAAGFATVLKRKRPGTG